VNVDLAREADAAVELDRAAGHRCVRTSTSRSRTRSWISRPSA
jgi:hypothetical protein